MRATDHPGLERTNRVWPELFGDGRTIVPNEDQRRHVAAMACAQDLRDQPQMGLSGAEEPDRMLFGAVYVRLRRGIETGRMG